MSRLFVTSACALFLVACSKPEPTAPVSQVKLELGEDI